MDTNIYKLLEEYGQIETNVSFKYLTSFKTGGIASMVIYPNSYFSLISIIDICKDNNIDFKIFGNGTNILASDDTYNGVIIKLTRTFNEYYFDDNYLFAQAGCSIISLAYKALEKGLSGLEFASGIPGSVGGCIFMNAGAYKSDMNAIVEEVQILDGNDLIWLDNKACQFSYRSSIFQKKNWIILNCKIRLEKSDPSYIQALMKERRERRLTSQPLEYPSAGSTFRNFDDHFAWQYIDEIGYRGKKVGGAAVSEKHSNFIINYNNATSSDIMELANQIQKEVKEKFDRDMVMEVEKFNW